MGGRTDRDSLQGQSAPASGDWGATAPQVSSDTTGGEAAAKVDLEALFGPPLEEAGTGGGDAAGHCLRSALSARPSSLAGLCSGSGPQHGKELVTKEKKGDTSNEVKKGTFLKRLDTIPLVPLTSCLRGDIGSHEKGYHRTPTGPGS